RMDRYTNHRGTQHAPMKDVAGLKRLQDDAVGMLRRFGAVHGLVEVRVKRLSQGVDALYAEFRDVVQQLLVDELETLAIIFVFRKGFELIYKQLLDNITKLGVERIDPLGKPFDPYLHQAMDRTETTEHADGVILQTFQPGYVFHGRVLRPAMVRVAVHPSPASKQAVN